MPEQMMRMAGRGDDGTAKAIKTDDFGRVEVNPHTEKRLLFDNKSLAKGEVLRSEELNSLGFKYANLTLNFGGERALKVKIIDLRETTNSTRLLFDGWAKDTLSIDYEIMTENYQIEIESTSDSGLYILGNHTVETLSHARNKEKNNSNIKKRIFASQATITLTNGESAKSLELNSLGFKFSNLTLNFGAERSFKVKIIDVVDDLERPRVIFDGQSKDTLSIDYEIMSEKYYIEIEATSEYGLFIRASETYTTYTECKSSDPHLTEIRSELSNIKDSLENVLLDGTQQVQPIKFPNKHLVFKKSPVPAQTMTKGTDGYFYIINGAGLVSKRESMIDNEEPIDEGITWDSATKGVVSHMFVADDGVVYFSNYDDVVNGRVPRIYHAENIHEEPNLVYENTQTENSYWTRQFGVDHYFNGKSYYLAGLYSGGDPKRMNRDLILSTDGGRTFEVVKQTSNLDETAFYNSHWHDVAIDHYHGLLWASEGDGFLNMTIWYSEDWGKNWVEFHDRNQPTTITPYPDKIVFGRDNNEVGFDMVRYPNDIENLNQNLFKPLKVIKTQHSGQFFALKPVTYENETYATFLLFGEGHSPMILASGDFGESWHGVWTSPVQAGEIYNFVSIDEKYVYAYRSGYDNVAEIIYAEKPKWIN